MNRVNANQLRYLPFLVFALSISILSSATAKPTLTSLSPRSVKIGTATELKATGTFALWPVQVWTDKPGLEFKLGDKGKLTVTAKKEMPPGIYLVRFLDSTGASEAVPLVVDFADAVVEKEPNESPKQPNVVKTPANVSGVLSKSGDVDCFEIDCKKGQTLLASVRANPLFGTTMDGILQVCDQRGFVLDQNDDKLGIDPQLQVKIPSDGKYFVRIFAFPAAPNSTVRFAGAADYRYLLTISNQTAFLYPDNLTDKQEIQNVSVVGPNPTEKPIVGKKDWTEQTLFFSPGVPGFFELPQSHAQAKAVFEAQYKSESVLETPFDFSGCIRQKGELDLIRFKGAKGKKIRLRVDARKFGFELDPVLTVFDENGKSLLNKDDNAKTDPDLVVDFSPPKDGVYFARIKDSADAGGLDYLYRFRGEPVEPDFALKVTASSFELADGKKFELEVTIERKDGFNSPIEISLAGLDKEIAVSSIKSEPKGDSAKKVKLVLESKKSFQKVVKIVGKSGESIRNAKFVLPSQRAIDEFVMTSKVAAKAKPAKK